jgi:serine protease
MKQIHSTYPGLLRLCAAAVIAASPVAAKAGVTEFDAQAGVQNIAGQTDRMIVKYRSTPAAVKGMDARVAVLAGARQMILARAGQQLGLRLQALHTTAGGAHVVHLGKKLANAEVAALARDLAARDPEVEYAEPDLMMVPMMTPNDPRYGEQWHYFESTGGLRANTAWDVANGSGVKVAVIDTGYRPHADLSGQFLPGYDFISSATIAADGGGRDADASDPGDSTTPGQCGAGSAPSNSSWHGTHVAGTIAARTGNGVGVAGVAYGAKIVPVRVLGKCGGYTSDIADAITWASGGTVSGVPANANKARVINMSLGGGGACGTTTQNAINGARSRGTAVVVAAGNSSTDASGSNPANCAGVITVAATNRSGGRAYYSNYGSVVDVAAPGGDARTAGGGVLSTLNAGATSPGSDNYAWYQGTSMAAPHVAGVAALMLSKTPSLTVDQIESTLKSTARAFPASCSGCGSGIVDATRALGGGTTTPPPTTGFNETEPNNTTGSANAVTASGTLVNGNMGSSSDTDYFRMQLAPGKTLTATLNQASSADYDLIVYNSNGAEIGRSELPAGSTDTVSVSNTGSSTFTRYIRVVYYSGGTGATNGKYTLKLSW